jgi:GNAT superfamily N-acetyltransferase
VYDGDAPADLVARLARAGLHEQARETVLVRAADDARASEEPPPGVRVHRLTREDELADYFAVDEAVWGTRFTAWVRTWLVPALAGASDPVGVFLAREAATPVGCGWVWLPRGRSFAHLFGGTVLPSHRHRGVYRAIVAARARLARASGFPWLVTDANDHSAPVLRRVGFEPIAHRIEMVLDAPAVPPTP